MIEFIIGNASIPEQPLIIHLVEEADGVSVRLRQGQSENIRVIDFCSDGRVRVHTERMKKFGLSYNIKIGRP